MTEATIGAHLGGYRLEARLGSGAVGDVYRATDPKLSRAVAIKVLHPHLMSDPDRVRRFQREALAASALNHPNIVHIYDFGHEGNTPFMVMELVEGRTLRAILADGPLPLAELLEVALQLADGLAKAHSEGIVHRDLKPDNVIVSTDGYVKILDFGLAKLLRPRPLAAANDDGSAFVTRDGALLGTAAYMSPEQAQGRGVDFRSDHFSLGAILYELATGRSAFRGDSVGETLVAVLRAEPQAIDELNPAVPHDYGRIARRCLAKRAERRYADTSDLARELRTLRDRTAHLASTSDVEDWAAGLPSTRRRWAGLAVAFVALALAVFGGWLLRPPTPEPASTGRLRLLASSQSTGVRARDPSLSPDGKMYAYVADRTTGSDLYVARVAGGDHVRLTDDEAFEAGPAFSPNGELVAFARVVDGVLPAVAIVPTLGGPTTTVVPAAGMPSWSPDGERLVFVMERDDRPRALGTSRRTGEDVAVLLEADAQLPFFYEPSWSPDGRLVVVQRSSGGVAGEIWIVPLDGRPPQRIDQEPSGIFMHEPVFLPDGQAVVVASNRGGATNLWRLPLDGGSPTPLTSGPGPDSMPTVATDGSIAFLNAVWRYTLRTFDVETRRTRELISHNTFLWGPAFRRDGAEIAFSQAEANGAWHVWSIPSAGGDAVQRTDRAGGEIYPRYGPTGLIFNQWTRPHRVWLQPEDGGPAQALTETGSGYGDVSPDGRQLAFVADHRGEEHVFVRRLDTDDPPRLLVEMPSTVPRWSPDGRWIAFARDRGVRGGIHVVAADGRDHRHLTSDGGWPTWWPDNRRIGYVRSAHINSQEAWTVSLDGGPPTRIDGLTFAGNNHPIDIAPDGRSIVATDSEHLIDQIWLLEPATTPSP